MTTPADAADLAAAAALVVIAATTALHRAEARRVRALAETLNLNSTPREAPNA